MSEKRTELSTALKEAMKAKDEKTLGTVRMIISKMKEQDIEARVKGNMEGIDDGQILSLMQGMIKQRQESAKMYIDGARPELAAKENEEIAIIEKFLPAQMSDDDIAAAIIGLIASTEATSIKDMGKVMGELKAKYAGQLDMGKAGAIIKQKLAG
ncbi:MAG: GatB/YqeY domain-containing protein [Alphaproteobacteria bacterium]|nr:GatB/YqeY domain-containing protein [Alphaproteobacteria bacterium]MCB1551904.1 GatB/YqeY domain-containing protein [Alphaproteobacteria bacterium]MCB9984325.1 GatB/YqeY domain-containing protein [Micavibrio sp.]HRK98722.1 GatB/YqeY domain-containing protein [Alphaproteobacteria bacterium]